MEAASNCAMIPYERRISSMAAVGFTGGKRKETEEEE
jgi:hypothetical protein